MRKRPRRLQRRSSVSLPIIMTNTADQYLPMTCAERLAKSWNSPIYTFFRARPVIEYVDSRRVHAFECAAVNCLGYNGRKVRRFLDTGDSKSTGRLHSHAKKCWGETTVKAALETRDLKAARAIVNKQPQADPKTDSTLTAAFERIGKGKVTYSHRQHTYAESR